MGWGDEIMVAGEARLLQEADLAAGREPRKVVVLNKRHKPRWHAAWENNPRIARPQHVTPAMHQLHNCSGHRPYIQAKTDQRYVWRGYGPPRGELYLSDAEQAFGACHAGAIVIEPNLKAGASPNKQWSWQRWQALVKLRPDWPWMQMVQPGQAALDGVRVLPVPGYRLAAAVLGTARAAVLPEGGLHHAAAALATPAAVIYGSHVTPSITGYGDQVNFVVPDSGHAPCGRRRICGRCQHNMSAIPSWRVAEALDALIEQAEAVA